jgi:3-deoxy-manno-octulosonate cytidylyltransferase (CMP-KDO synthetase)
MLRALGVIPARYASTRFPGKPLAPLGNGTLMSAVWSAARAAKRLDRVVVATEDDRILDACGALGAEAMLTSADHVSGSDRVAEVVRRAGEPFDVVVNIQGDEPFVTATTLDRLVAAFDNRPDLRMATTAEPLEDVEDLFDPGCVKVVTTERGEALYFSRAPIPFLRGPGRRLRHLGVYGFLREALEAFAGWPRSPLEEAEGLEQLRLLEHGIPLRILTTDASPRGIDTRADYDGFLGRLRAKGGSGWRSTSS